MSSIDDSGFKILFSDAEKTYPMTVCFPRVKLRVSRRHHPEQMALAADILCNFLRTKLHGFVFTRTTSAFLFHMFFPEIRTCAACVMGPLFFRVVDALSRLAQLPASVELYSIVASRPQRLFSMSKQMTFGFILSHLPFLARVIFA